MPRCLITGCGLEISEEGKSLHGDLHRVGNTYVFNGRLDANGEAAWVYGQGGDCVVVYVPGDYFERRGVIVFEDAFFSEDATAHLEAWA